MSSWLVILLALLSPIPVGADQTVRRTPWITYGLILANTAVYLVTQPDRSGDSTAFYAQYGVVPNHPTWHSLITSLFVHTSLLHLFFNMAFLWAFGPLVEAVIPPVMFVVLYLGGGVTAALLQTAIVVEFVDHTHGFLALAKQPLVGASGAISAVLAPFAIRYYRSRIRLLWLPAYLVRNSKGDLQVPAVIALLVWLVLNVAGGIRGFIVPESGGVAYWAHFGGFVFGLVMAALTGLYIDGRQEYLLSDARTAVARGAPGFRDAVDKYRAFLEFEPRNVEVRLELTRALAGLSKVYGSSTALTQAATEIATSFREYYSKDNLAGAMDVWTTAKSEGVPLSLTPRERLRLAGAAQEAGDKLSAIELLDSLLADDHDDAEDEIARLKLGQLLATVDPPRAADVLGGMIRKYPDSDWIRLARQLLAQVQS